MQHAQCLDADVVLFCPALCVCTLSCVSTASTHCVILRCCGAVLRVLCYAAPSVLLCAVLLQASLQGTHLELIL